MIYVLLGLLLLCFLLFIYFKFFKIPKVKNLVFIDGGLGSGKSFLSVKFAITLYKKQLRKFKIKLFILGLFKGEKWKKKQEMPLLYSNIPLKDIPFVPLSKEIIYRQKRFNYRSVLLLDECSLMNDQMDYKNAELSERLSEFYKLFRHETKGGYCVVNSQSISDMHYSFKYCINEYFYIHHKTRLLFFSILKIQEFVYSAENSVLQTNENDIEDNTKILIVSNRYFKKYDSYCHSVYTDNLKREKKTIVLNDRKKLKSKDFLTFKEITYIQDKRVVSDINCPKCGALMKINLENDYCSCDYCGCTGYKNVFLRKGGVKYERN